MNQKTFGLGLFIFLIIPPVANLMESKAVQNQEKKAAHKELKIQKALIKEETKNAQKSEKGSSFMP